MSYTLTLTKSERDAMDWVGERYRHGDELGNLLDKNCPEASEWSEDNDITFTIPEHVAWEMREIIEGDDGRFNLDCFRSGLCAKLIKFWEGVV